MLQIKKIIGHVLFSNSYLLFRKDVTDCYLIDAGDANQILNELPDYLGIKGIFLTHGHFDHVSGIKKLINCFPDCKIYTSKYGKEALGDTKKNLSAYHDLPVSYIGDNVIIISEGERIELFDDTFINILETPGHCQSCLTYYTNHHIFTGDSYIPGAKVVTTLPKGNKTQANISLQRILELSKDRIICAGHDTDKWVSIL